MRDPGGGGGDGERGYTAWSSSPSPGRTPRRHRQRRPRPRPSREPEAARPEAGTAEPESRARRPQPPSRLRGTRCRGATGAGDRRRARSGRARPGAGCGGDRARSRHPRRCPKPPRTPRSGVSLPGRPQAGREHGLDLSQVTGTGEGGRITRKDVRRYRRRRPKEAVEPEAAAPATALAGSTGAAPAAAAPAPAAPAAVAGRLRPRQPPLSELHRVAAGGGGLGRRSPSTGSGRIGENMIRAKQTAAHVWTSVEVDFETVERVRQAHKDEWKEHEGFSLTYLPFIARATIDALKDFPVVNSSFFLEEKKRFPPIGQPGDRHRSQPEGIDRGDHSQRRRSPPGRSGPQDQRVGRQGQGRQARARRRHRRRPSPSPTPARSDRSCRRRSSTCPTSGSSPPTRSPNGRPWSPPTRPGHHRHPPHRISGVHLGSPGL